MTNKELAQRILTGKEITKRWEKRLKEWREKILENLNEEVDTASYSITEVDKGIAATEEDARLWFEATHGSTFSIESVKEHCCTNAWEITYKLLPKYTSVEQDFDDLAIKKVVYSVQEDLDLDLLYRVDPELFNRVTKQVVETVVNEEALASEVKDNPTAIISLQKAVRAGKPRIRLDINRK